MAMIDFMSALHKSTARDYLARVNDPEFPKAKAASLAKTWGFDYWDGDRRINYGGYRYLPGRWTPVARALVDHYGLNSNSRVLDVGCGKGFLLLEIAKLLPGIDVRGIDISGYAIEQSPPEIRDSLQVGCASSLPYAGGSFDLVISINTLHNLSNSLLERALREIDRVSARSAYICVESFRSEVEMVNLLYWQVTCRQFCSPDDWQWWFEKCGFKGDYSFIYFE
jgi:protein-L-isoaspartate(D-aspartate) O-methyltransferase